jgi:hypothetical protein
LCRGATWHGIDGARRITSERSLPHGKRERSQGRRLFACPGGGQVVVRSKAAYVGHVKPPDGTSIIDVSDPARPRELAQIKVSDGTLPHKVRVENGVMLVNREVFPIGRKDQDFRGRLV